MKRVLVSACLLGRPVRYDGRAKPQHSEILDRWTGEGRVVAICPEVAGGLSTPRPPAETVGGDGFEVLDGRARVLTRGGDDVTDAFVSGAQAALELALFHGIELAVLKARSPSCGSGAVYDGTFSATPTDGFGVTAALLRRHGIAVFDESQFAEADAFLRKSSAD